MAKDKNLELTISIQASEGNTKEVFALLSKNAESVGKAITTAFDVNTKNFENKYKSLATAILNVKTSAVTPTKQAIKDMLDIKVAATNKSLQSVAKNISAIGTSAVSAKGQVDALLVSLSKLNSGKFAVGTQTGSKTSSTPTTSTAEIKNATVAHNDLAKSITSVSRATVEGSLNAQQAVNNLGRTFGKTSSGFQQITAQMTGVGGALSNVTFRSKETAIEFGRAIDSIVGKAKKAPLNILGDANTAARNQALNNQIPINKASREQTTPLGYRTTTAPSGGSQPTFIPDQFFKDAEKKALMAGENVSKNLTKGFKSGTNSYLKEVEALTQSSNNRFTKLFSANFFADLAYGALSSGLKALESLSIETIKYAARTEELGVVLQSVARQNHISTESIVEQEQAIKSLNITTQDARETLTRFIAVGFDVKDAGPLARVAQDLAVISGKNTSEELNQLVIAIQTLQSRNLRNAGVYITVDETLDHLSATTGRARDSFSTLEKQQAVMNATIEYGAKVAGTYEAAMSTTSKQLRSMDRIFKEAQNSIGSGFIPIMELAVTATKTFLEFVTRFPAIFQVALLPIASMTVALIAFKTQLIETAAASVATTFVNVKSFAKGEPTAQAEINALKKEALVLDRQKLQLQIQANEALTADTYLNGILTNEKEAQLALERKILINQDNQLAAKSGTTARFGEKASRVIGNIGLIGAAIGVLIELGTVVYSVFNAPLKVESGDVNSAFNNLKEFQEKQQATYDLTLLYQDTMNVKVTELTKITDVLSYNNQTYVDSLIKQNGITKENLDIAKGLLAVEQESARLKIQDQIGASQLQFRNAATNYEASLQKEQARNEQRRIAQASLDAFNNRPDGLSSDELIQLQDRAIYGQQVMDNLASSANDFQNTLSENAGKFTTQYGELQKFSEIYGLNTTKVFDGAIGHFDKASLIFDKLHDNIVKTTKALEDLKAPLSDSLSSSDKIKESLSKDYNTGLEKARQKVLDEANSRLLDLQSKVSPEELKTINDRDYNPEALQKLFDNAKKAYDTSFGSGQAGDERRATLSSFLNKTLEDSGDKSTGLQRTIKLIELYRKLAGEDAPLQPVIGALSDTSKLNDELTSTTELIKLLNDNAPKALATATNKLGAALSQDPKARKQLFDAESIQEQSSNLDRYLRLRYKLYGDVKNDDVALSGNPDKLREGVELLQIEEGVRSKIREESRRLLTFENEIRVLRETASIPAIKSELLIQKQILETTKERKQTEQQLTADIALEIDKRRRYSLDSVSERNRVGAEVFLSNQQDERKAQEDLLKSQYQLALERGDTSAFDNNPLVQEAIKQAEALAEIDKKGGLQVLKIDETNDILRNTQTLTSDGNAQLINLNQNFTSLQEEIKRIALNASDSISGSLGGEVNLGQTKNEVQKTFENTFSRVFTPAGAARLTSTLKRETSFNSSYANREFEDPRSAQWWKYGSKVAPIMDFGMLSWNGKRRDRFKSNLGGRSATVQDNANFVVQELTSDYSKFGRVLKDPNATEAEIEAAVKGYVGYHDKHLGEDRKIYRQLYGGTARVVNKNKAVKASVIKGTDAIDISEANGLKKYNEFLSTRDLDTETYFLNAKLANRQQTIDRNRDEVRGRYANERRYSLGFGITDKQDELSVEQDKLNLLLNKDYTEQQLTFLDAKINRVKEQANLEKEILTLQEESGHRIFQYQEYADTQRKKFGNEQITTAHQLQDEEIKLALTKEAFNDKESLYSKNLAKRQDQDRAKERQDIAEKLRLLERERDLYIGTAQQRLDIEARLKNERVEADNSVSTQIIESETRTANIREGIENRLLLRKTQLNEEYAKRYEDALTKQLELEIAYQQKREEVFKPEEFRNNVLDKILSETKSTTELISGVWVDSFDAISGGFGSLLGKLTSKMGIFGDVVKNLLQGLFNNLLGGLFHNLLGQTAPTSGGVESVLSGIAPSLTGGATTGKPSLLGAENVAGASAVAAGSINYLATAAGQAAVALMQIAGQVGMTGAGIVNAMSRGGGATGGGGGHMSFGGIGGAGGANAGFGIPSIVQSGQGGVGSALGGLGLPPLSSFINVAIPPSHSLGIGSILGNNQQIFSANQAAQGVGGAVNSGLGSGLSKMFNLKGLGQGLLTSLPAIGGGLGTMLGGQSGLGQALGGIGGTLGGIAGLGIIGALAPAGAFGGIFAQGGALASLGGLSAATLGIGAAIAGAFLLVSFLLGRAKRRKAEIKNVNQWSGDALKQMQDMLKAVKSDKMDGDEALTRADEIISAFQDNIKTLKDKKSKALAQTKLNELRGIKGQIEMAAQAQTRRRELDDKIVPTYASGGVASNELIRVSRGERLYHPDTVATMKDAFINAGIPSMASRSSSYRKSGLNYVQIPGKFDGRDDILVNVPKGTIIANPKQQMKIDRRGYASGGVAGTVSAPAAQAVTVQAPPVTAIIVMSKEEAVRFGTLIPGSVIVEKVSTHVKSTGSKGLAGQILQTLTE